MDAYVVDAVRTVFGRNRGGLSRVRSDDLAAIPIRELVARRGIDPASIDDVVLGNTNGAGEENRNLGRMAALLADLPVTVPGLTVNRLCGSGSEAIVSAAREVASGDATFVIAGGAESMSRAPFVLQRPEEPFARTMELHQTVVGWRMVNPRFRTEWTDPLGTCAERSAAREGVSRAEQDDWALRSHALADAAWNAGLHDDWVLPVEGVTRDESIRPDTSAEQLAALRPAFTPDGTVTAGNASPINDGALAALVTNAAGLADLGVEPLGRILASATVAVAPDDFAMAPVPAIREATRRAGVELADLAVVELQEAFAAVVLSCLKHLPELDRDRDRVNPHGGAIAYGHPLGASGARLTVDLCRELRRRGGGIGALAVCIGVGLGQAIVVEV
ncbi:MAG: thiolase family protein [Actinomycetota bacterium]